MATNAESVDSGATTGVTLPEYSGRSIAVDFPHGVPATHRHAIRSLLYRLTVEQPLEFHNGISKYNVRVKETGTYLTLYHNGTSCVSTHDVMRATDFNLEDLYIQTWKGRVTIKFPK